MRMLAVCLVAGGLAALPAGPAIAANLPPTLAPQPPVIPDTLKHVHSIAVGDLDGDGRPDVALVGAGESGIDIFDAEPNGTLRANDVPLDADEKPTAVAIGDVTGDGRPDLVTLNAAGQVTVRPGHITGDVRPTGYQTSANVGLALGDVNGDGRVDVVTVAVRTASVLLSRTDGSLAPQAQVSLAQDDARAVAVADVDGDGLADLVTTNYTDYTVSVARGRPGGGFLAPVDIWHADGETFPLSLELGDMNGDGRPDVVVAGEMGVVVIPSRPGDLPGPPVGYHDVETASLALGDFNADRRLDVAVAWSPNLWIWPGRGDGELSPALTPLFTSPKAVAQSLQVVASADFQRDGRPDLVVASDMLDNGIERPEVIDLLNATPWSSAQSPAEVSKKDFTVSFTADGAYSKVVLYARGPSQTAFAPVAESTDPSHGTFAYSATEGDGDYAFYTEVVDADGNTEVAPDQPDSVSRVTLTPASTATPGPTPCASARRGDSRSVGVTINDAAKYTNRAHAQLTIVPSPTATGVIISNDGGFSRAVSRPLQSAERYPWTLQSTAPERLPKTVYVRFTGPCIDASQTFADDIILDQTPPAIAAVTLRPPRKGRGPSQLRLRAADNASGLAQAEIRIRARVFALRFRSRLRLAGAPRDVRVRVRDGAGNYSPWRRARVARSRSLR